MTHRFRKTSSRPVHNAASVAMGVMLASLASGCDLPEDFSSELEPGAPLEVLAQGARIPQLTKIDPATVFSGASTTLLLTGKNFSPDTRVTIDGTAIPITKLVSTTQLQVTLPSTVNALGKKNVRVESSATFRGSERNDLLTVQADPLNLAPIEQTIENEPAKQILSVDLNGDGKADLLTLASDGTSVRVLLSGGRGRPSGTLFRLSGSGVAISAADVTGDGKTDLIVATTAMIGTYPGDGAGNFASPVWSSDSRLAYVDSLPNILSVGDVTGDGKSDVCFGTRRGEIAYAAGKGDGTYLPSVVLRTETMPVLQLRVDDANGDGKLDVLAVNGGSDLLLGKMGGVSVILMGTATPSVSFSYSAVERFTAVTSGDYNRDGKLDVAALATDGKVNVFYGTGDGKFPTSRQVSAGYMASQLFSIDWNRDGKVDLVMGGKVDSTSVGWTGWFIQGAGDGSFATATSIKPLRNSFSTIAVGDVDGDGKLDLVGLDDKSGKGQLLFGRGDGTLLTSPDSLLRDYVVSGDWNGDGIIDLASASVVSNYVNISLGSGDGSFKSSSAYYPVDKGPSGISAGDMNGDGKLDVVAANYDTSVVSLLLGNGDGSLATQRTFSVGKTPTGIAVADLNGDGMLDVVTSNADSDNVSVLIGNGTGNFATSKEYAAGKYPVAVLVADFNADGRPDVVTANADAGTLSFLQGSAVTAGALNTARALTACASPSSLFATDLNGDGKLDLLTACADAASVAYLLGKGDGTFNPAKLIPVCDFPSDVQAAQLSDDTRPDLVIACGTPKQLQFLVQVSDLSFSPSPRTADLGRGFFVGDVTGDRKADVLLTESPTQPQLLINTSK